MRVVDDLRLRARALRVQGCTQRAIAVLLGVSHSHVHRLLTWDPPYPPADAAPPEKVRSPEKVAGRVAELHAKLQHGPHALERLICLLLGERPVIARAEGCVWVRGGPARTVRRYAGVSARG